MNQISMFPNEESPKVIFENLIKNLKTGEYNLMFMDHDKLLTITGSTNPKTRLAGIEIKKNKKSVRLFTTFGEQGLTSNDLTSDEIKKLTAILKLMNI